MLESTVEKSLVQLVKKLGGVAYKFVSPARRGVPDRLVLLPIPERDREIVQKYVMFVECKAPGKKPRPEQVREITILAKMGYIVRIQDHTIPKTEMGFSNV